MSELALQLLGWTHCDSGTPAERRTTGSLCIAAGEDLAIPVTEVEDRLGQTVRPHIIVPLVSMAEWLIVNWWRLRWEGRPESPSTAWRRAHCLAAISGESPWPPLELSSDGQFIHLNMEAEPASDVAAIRYLRQVTADVAASEFEAAVDRFLDQVEARLSSVEPDYRDLTELRQELTEERSRPSIARACRWQALAGIDPGEAPDKWLEQAELVTEDAGPTAGDEILGVLPELNDGLQTATEILAAIKQSATSVDLSWIASEQSPNATVPGERPWQAGARLALQMRRGHSLQDGPLDNATLSDLLSTPVPLQGEVAKDVALGGGYRNGTPTDRTSIVVPSARQESQRFFLARMIGAAHVLSADEHLIAVTRGDSALQKLERSFAQELLCPWSALDAFTDEHGMHDEALAEAADHFQVSDWLVRSTLVNRGKMSRHRLPRQLM